MVNIRPTLCVVNWGDGGGVGSFLTKYSLSMRIDEQTVDSFHTSLG